MGNDAKMNVSPHNLIKAEAYEWVVKRRTSFLRGHESAGEGPKIGRKVKDKL